MNSLRHSPGDVCWVDLGTPDPAAAASFYGSLFGWTYTPPDAIGYQLALLESRAASGLGPAEDPGLPYWTVNLGVEDIDVAVSACIAAGAVVVVTASSVGDAGKAAVLVDPVGAPFSLWQPGSQTGMQVVGEDGSFAAIELLTARPEAATAFYTTAFGWLADAGQFTSDDVAVAALGRTAPPAATPHESLWLVQFAVSDVRATVRAALQLGASRAPLDSSAAAVLRDPAGALFGLMTSSCDS